MSKTVKVPAGKKLSVWGRGESTVEVCAEERQDRGALFKKLTPAAVQCERAGEGAGTY